MGQGQGHDLCTCIHVHGNRVMALATCVIRVITGAWYSWIRSVKRVLKRKKRAMMIDSNIFRCRPIIVNNIRGISTVKRWRKRDRHNRCFFRLRISEIFSRLIIDNPGITLLVNR